MSHSPVREELRQTFPELSEIDSVELRDGVLDVWEEALERGDWSVADLSRIPASLHLTHTGIGLVEHTRAVTQVTLAAVDAYESYYPDDANPLNRDHVTTGSLVHDVGKVLEYDEVDGVWQQSADGAYVRHPFSGVALCEANGLPAEIQHMVAFHSHEGDAYDRSPEATVLHLADFINFDPLRADDF